MKWVVQAHIGSALRLSQPLSGFLAHPDSTALFRAAAVPGIPPFRVFPSQESRTPLGATCSLAVVHERAGTRLPGPCYRRFRRLPRSHAQSPDSPDGYGLPFAHPRARSRSPWTPSGRTVPFHPLHRLRSLRPPASPFAPARVAPSRRPILSWVSAPLEPSPPTPRILRPVLARGLEHASSSGDSDARLPGPRDPENRVGPSRHRKHQDVPVGGFLAPLEATPNRLSTTLLLPWPWNTGRTRHP
jgi:hypothetical protein